MKKLALMVIAAGLLLLGCNDELGPTNITPEQRQDQLVSEGDSISQRVDSLLADTSWTSPDTSKRYPLWPAMSDSMDIQSWPVSAFHDWNILPPEGLVFLSGLTVDSSVKDWSWLWNSCGTLKYLGLQADAGKSMEAHLGEIVRYCPGVTHLSMMIGLKSGAQLDTLSYLDLECLDISGWDASLNIDFTSLPDAVAPGGTILAYNPWGGVIPQSVIDTAAAKGVTILAGPDWTGTCVERYTR